MTVPITDLPLSGSARERDGDNSQSLDLKKVHQPSPSPRLKSGFPTKTFPPSLAGHWLANQHIAL